MGELAIDHDLDDRAGRRQVSVSLELRGRGQLAELVASLEDLDGVVGVAARDPSSVGDSP